MDNQYKQFSDPVHGFIAVPRELLLPLILTPEVQRLRRIRQLGVGYLVFPGGEHTRFTHALGAMALMQDTLASLAEKGTQSTQALATVQAGAAGETGAAVGEDQLSLSGANPQQAQLAAPQVGYEQHLDSAKSVVSEDPKRVAQVVKNWVNEDG